MKNTIVILILSWSVGVFSQAKTIVSIAGEKLSYPPASISTPFTPIGGISATNTQNAIGELDVEKADKTNGVSQITDLNSGNYIYIGSLGPGETQMTINTAINAKLAAMPIDADIVHISGTETIIGEKTFNTNVNAVGFTIPGGTSNEILLANGGKIDKAAVGSVPFDGIRDATTTTSPSENAVFDALLLKAPLASPAFLGVPTAPTATPGTSTNQIASTAFVNVITNSKENTVSAGTVAQYYRGDKTWQTLNTAVIIDPASYANIGSALNDTQATINAKIDLAIGTLKTTSANNSFLATASQTVFLLSAAPIQGSVKFYINGTRISDNAVAVTGNSLTYNSGNNGSYTLMAGDIIIIDYSK